jgi:hypothetical protein
LNPITLSLATPNGGFVFTDAEVPAGISFGGQQMLHTNRLVGGRRIIDAMGPDDAPLSWSALFLFQSALPRARFLDTLRRQGAKCTLSWDELRYTVIISDFHADYRKPYRIPYSITMTVVEDLTQPVNVAQPQTAAQAIQQDMARANSIFGCLGDTTLAGLGASLQGAFDAVNAAVQPIAAGLKPVTSLIAGAAGCAGEIANGVTSAVAAVVAPFAALDAQVQRLITNAETAVSAVATIGGIAPGSSMAQSVGKTIAQVNSAVQLPELYELQSISKRMQANLHLIQSPTSSKAVVVGGGNLYQIAAQQYGDAGRWTDIAKANGLSDPNLTGFETLVIPA